MRNRNISSFLIILIFVYLNVQIFKYNICLNDIIRNVNVRSNIVLVQIFEKLMLY